MAYALWLPDVLTDAGLIVRTYPGWETRGKSDFAPSGHMLHHTVTKPTAPDLTIDKFLAVTGSASTPAPLANISTNRDGSVSVIAAGTANHGGAGNWKGVSGNKNWIGDEMKNLGSGVPTSVWYEPWVPGQVEAAQRAAAACLNHIAADASWLVGHKEYATPPGRKTDPHTLNMNTIRATVKTIMEDDMSKQDALDALAEFFGSSRRVNDPQGMTNPDGSPRTRLYVDALIDSTWHPTAGSLPGKNPAKTIDYQTRPLQLSDAELAALADQVVAAMTPGIRAAVAAELAKLKLVTS